MVTDPNKEGDAVALFVLNILRRKKSGFVKATG
jgi:hypothetical protein